MATAPILKNSVAKMSKGNYKYFDKLGKEDKAKNVKMLEYIKQLAALTSTNISRFDISGMFGSGDGKNLIDSKAEINRILFDKIKETEEKKKTKTAPKSVDKIKGLVSALEKQAKKTIDTRKRNLKQTITNEGYNVSNYYNSISSTIKRINDARTELGAMGDASTYTEKIKKEIEDIISEGCWTNPVFDKGYLYFNTKNHVVITHQNKAASLDIKVDLGQLAVKINVSDLYMKVIPYKGNITSGDIYHPHINFDGDICWGSAYNKIGAWQTQGDITNLLKMLYSLLFNYNEGDAYVRIADLSSLGKTYVIKSDDLRHPDNVKKEKKAEKTDESPVNAPVANIDYLAATDHTDGYTVTISNS